MTASLYLDGISYAMIVCAIFVVILLTFLRAPYGRYASGPLAWDLSLDIKFAGSCRNFLHLLFRHIFYWDTDPPSPPLTNFF